MTYYSIGNITREYEVFTYIKLFHLVGFLPSKQNLDDSVWFALLISHVCVYQFTIILTGLKDKSTTSFQHTVTVEF